MPEADMPNKPTFIYFDLGNVLFHFDHARVCRQLAEVSGLARGDVEAFFANSDYERTLETGQISPREAYNSFCRRLRVSPPFEEAMTAVSDIFVLNASILPLITRLVSANQRLGILSNTNAPHWEFLIKEGYAILPDFFELTVLSYQIKSMKPDHAIYHAATELAGVAPHEIFFTDDRIENVQAALDAGWQAVQFTSAHELEETLRQRGVEFN